MFFFLSFSFVRVNFSYLNMTIYVCIKFFVLISIWFLIYSIIL